MISLPEIPAPFKEKVRESLAGGTFIKLTLGNYQGTEKELKNVYVRTILIKGEEHLAFTYRYRTRDIFKNHLPEQGLEIVSELLQSGFRSCTCFTAAHDLMLIWSADKGFRFRGAKPSLKAAAPAAHDHQKKRLLKAADKPYLQALKITDHAGEVFKNAQDKYKQINQYVALLDPLIRSLPARRLKVADMGSGKGYLTFALYDYLVNVLKLDPVVTGVEYRQDLVALCNRISAEAGFSGLEFVQGAIGDYSAEQLDLLIALHACDTATDDAIAKGIRAGAALIVVAPCCHKQIRREMEKGKVKNDLGFITRHGVFMEREAVMVTDGIRALILEYFGYKTKISEFISDAHTPKNVLITAVKTGSREGDSAILEQIRSARSYFGISRHYLEELMEL